MTARLVVLDPGLHTTLQDRGRSGHQALGVPAGGALDPLGLALANALVGNQAGMAGLEITMVGPRLAVEGGTLRLAVAGPARLKLDRAGKSEPLAADRSHLLKPGDILSIGVIAGRRLASLAVAGGFAIAPVLGSLSCSPKAGIGPLGGRPLAAGDVLALRPDASPAGPEYRLARPPAYGHGPLRILFGPEADRLTAGSLEALLSGTFTIGRESDRMGLRLDGPRLALAGPSDILPAGLATGCIQLPGDGRPILLLADHQTTGGYARIAGLISADLPRAAQLMPGAPLSFRAVNLDEALAARRRLNGALESCLAALARLEPPALSNAHA